MTSRTVNRLTLGAMLAMFAAAMVVLYHQLEATRLADVVAHLRGMPVGALAGAALLTASSYLVLTGYDFLALRYVRRALPARSVLLASFAAFAFSNAIGFALVSGGSVRYRLYSRLGLRAVEIGEIVAFCTVSYALGVCMVGGLMLILDSSHMAGALRLPHAATALLGAAIVALPLSYLAATLARRRPIRLGRYHLRLPSFGLGLAQVALGCVDQVVAASVLYVLLAPGVPIPFVSFLGVYLVAAPASVLSLVPGGLGVLETMVVVLLQHGPKGVVLGTLLAYRFIYFLLPLALAMTAMAALQVARAAPRAPQRCGGKERDALQMPASGLPKRTATARAR